MGFEGFQPPSQTKKECKINFGSRFLIFSFFFHFNRLIHTFFPFCPPHRSVVHFSPEPTHSLNHRARLKSFSGGKKSTSGPLAGTLPFLRWCQFRLREKGDARPQQKQKIRWKKRTQIYMNLLDFFEGRMEICTKFLYIEGANMIGTTWFPKGAIFWFFQKKNNQQIIKNIRRWQFVCFSS